LHFQKSKELKYRPFMVRKGSHQYLN